MRLNRRSILAASVGVPALSFVGVGPVSARTPLTGTQMPGAYRLKVGDAEVTALADGALRFEFGQFPEADRAEAERLVEAAALTRSYVPGGLNGYLVNTGRSLVLIDAGGGGALGPSAGRLLGNLRAAGVEPAAIDTVLLTHLHPDHASGLIGSDGAAVFPNAEVHVAEPEHAFWTDDGVLSRAPAGAKKYFEMARASIAPYATAGRLKRFVPGGEALPGIASIPAFGHTPGHTMFRVGSGKDALLVWGDIVHAAALQFAHPEWGITYDADRAKAAETRRRVFEEVATDRVRIAGMHLGFPGLGHINRTGTVFAFAPAQWAPII